MNYTFFWFVVTVLCLAACTYLPIRIKDAKTRRRVSWFVLIPISLILIFYVYPVGIELFKKWALSK